MLGDGLLLTMLVEHLLYWKCACKSEEAAGVGALIFYYD